MLGSAQVRIDTGEETWVVSGDYKRDPDPTCAPFEVLPCDVFISEATFALPIYRWPSTRKTDTEIDAALTRFAWPGYRIRQRWRGLRQDVLGELAWELHQVVERDGTRDDELHEM